MLVLKIDQMNRNDMVKIAEASSAKMTAEMEAFLTKLIEDGKYAKPTETSSICLTSCLMKWRRRLNSN